MFKNIRNILDRLHILLPPEENHKKILANIPRTGFKKSKSLKGHILRPALPKVAVASDSSPFGRKMLPCELCKLMKNVSTF